MPSSWLWAVLYDGLDAVVGFGADDDAVVFYHPFHFHQGFFGVLEVDQQGLAGDHVEVVVGEGQSVGGALAELNPGAGLFEIIAEFRAAFRPFWVAVEGYDMRAGVGNAPAVCRVAHSRSDIQQGGIPVQGPSFGHEFEEIGVVPMVAALGEVLFGVAALVYFSHYFYLFRNAEYIQTCFSWARM